MGEPLTLVWKLNTTRDPTALLRLRFEGFKAYGLTKYERSQTIEGVGFMSMALGC